MSLKLVQPGRRPTQNYLPLFATMEKDGDPPADPHAEERLDIAELLIVRPDATFFVRVEGEVEDDASILPGDILVVDRSLTPMHGDTVIVIEDGDLAIKVLRTSPQTLRLVSLTSSSDNSAPPLNIQGVVLWMLHKAR